MIKKLDEKILKQEVMDPKETRPVVIDFSAVWCAPCRIFKPIIEELAEELEGRVLFYETDVNEQQALAEQFEISSVPTLVLMQNGRIRSESVGVRSKDELLSWIF